MNVFDALARSTGAPPLLVKVTSETTFSEHSKIIIAAAPADWASLATFDWSGAQKLETFDLGKLLLVARQSGWTPRQIVEAVAKGGAIPQVDYSAVSDDLPPPSGDSDSSEGRAEPDPVVQARRSHVAVAGGFGPHLPFSASNSRWGLAADLGPYPARAATMVGEVVEDHKLSAETPALVFADPNLKARQLVLGIGETKGAIAVLNNGNVAALRIQFIAEGQILGHDVPWIELRVPTRNHFELEAVPSRPVMLRGLNELKTTLATLRESRRLDAWSPVDILVGRDVDVQQLVDAIVAVDQAGAHAVGVGDMPDANELALRGHAIRVFFMRPVVIDGDADRAPVVRVLKQAALESCYETALASNQQIEGTISVRFVIDATGHVLNSTVEGVDPSLSRCIATEIKARQYPTHGKATVGFTIRVAPERLPSMDSAVLGVP